MLNHLMQVCAALDIRLDAKETAALDFQLEHLKEKTYDILYPMLKARDFIPLDSSVDAAAETFAYHEWDHYGMADIIANYADDLSLVDTAVEKFSSPIHSLGKGFQYSIMDIRRASKAGNQLPDRRARAARTAVERKIDEVMAFGDPAGKLKGFLNHPNVPIFTAANDGTDTVWVETRGSPKSPQDIKLDMATLVNNIFSTTKEVHAPDTLIIPTLEYGHIAQTPIDTTNQTTILQSFLANSPWIQNIDSWHKLDSAAADGTARMVAYSRNPEYVEMVIPQEFEQFPPQPRNLAFVVPCHARVGGVKFYYPLSAAYMDGLRD
jgi:hypothetical protein